MTREDRLRLALQSKGWDISTLARRLGVSQPAVSTIVNGKRSGLKLLPRIAAELGVALEWLTVGSNPPAWAAQSTPRTPPAVPVIGPSAIPIEGVVSAGSGTVAEWHGAGGVVSIPASWRAVRVQGDSAYPAIYPGQLALIDEARGIDIAELDERTGWDLDDDVVLVRLQNDRALLKRFCFHPPRDFVLASVNGGRRSPLIARDEILQIVPVVAVIWNDPGEDRGERWRQKRDRRETEGVP